MGAPILGDAAGAGYGPHIDRMRVLPAGYAQFFGYLTAGLGTIGKVGLWLSGGGCSSVEVGIYNSVASGGHWVPHELLASGTMPPPPLAAPIEGFGPPDPEGAETLENIWQFLNLGWGLRGPEGVEENEVWPPGAEPYFSGLTGPPKHPGDVLTDRWKYICRDAEGKVLLEAFYTISVKRLTRPETDLGNVWVPISDAPVPFANGVYETNADNIGGEGEPHSTFKVTVTELPETPIPAGTVTVEVEIQAGRTEWYAARPNAGMAAGYSFCKVRPHEGRHPAPLAGPSQEWFIAARPVGGDLLVPFTKSGGGADRHKGATELVDNPAVVVAGEGGAGEFAPVAFAAASTDLAQLI